MQGHCGVHAEPFGTECGRKKDFPVDGLLGYVCQALIFILTN